ncbi:hypothetical protein [Paenibacillus pinihumi]|uniref:hypothetical protein n=1 Tax=Paenibacillus pinihumi TaxID=669462 RepID=UPI00041E70CD|nr:hypothetical protein [Paenibacillus pinihumi]
MGIFLNLIIGFIMAVIVVRLGIDYSRQHQLTKEILAELKELRKVVENRQKDSN